LGINFGLHVTFCHPLNWEIDVSIGIMVVCYRCSLARNKKKQNDIIDSVDIDNDADVFGPL